MNSTIKTMVNKGGCIKKGSSIINWKKMHNFSQQENTSSNTFHQEMKPLLLQTRNIEELKGVKAITEEEPYAGYLTFIKNHYKEKGSLSHARSLLTIMKRVCNTHYGHENVFNVMCDEEYIKHLYAELTTSKSFRHKKMVLIHFYNYYFDMLYSGQAFPMHKLFAMRVLKNCKPLPPSLPTRQSSAVLHPQLQRFIEEIDEKGQKWQKRARLHISYFLRWYIDFKHYSDIDPNEVNIKEINSSDMEYFRHHLIKRVSNEEIITETAQGYIQSVKSWFGFLKKSKHIYKNPTVQMKNFNIIKNSNYDLPLLKKAIKLFDVIINHSDDMLQDLAIFSLLAGLGLRAAEVLSLERKNIDQCRWEAKFLRKGGKEQVLPLPSICSLFLELHMENLDKDGPLWRNKIGTQLRYKSLLRKFHKYKKIAGITEDIGGLHFFRYLIITELLSAHTDERAVQHLAGHNSVIEINRYAKHRKSEVHISVKTKLRTIGSGIHVNKN
ncbi:MAG: tyrosine-type recombinase/integrase [Dethiobacter sp.]|nr:tyrosine-type recombinase/integrase [Dethiobacter sp.]